MPPKRKAIFINTNIPSGDSASNHDEERAAKRFKADSSQLDPSLHALSQDSLLNIAAHLDIFSIVALFSTSKGFAQQLSKEQIWRELCLLRLGPVVPSSAKTMSWRTLFLHLNKTKRPLEYVEQILARIKSSADLSDLQRLQILSNTIANQEFQQTLVDQVQEFLQAHPSLLPLWNNRTIYSYYEVFAAAEWSMENYKWDVTSTAPVKLLIVGTNGKVLQLTSLSSYFACAWAYNMVTYFKPEVKPIEQVFSAQPPSMGGYCSDEELRVPDDADECDEAADRDQNAWFREQPISQILLPFTPEEDDTDEHLMRRLEEKGWYDIDKYPVELFASLLQQIGLSDVAAEEFKALFVRATFPDREQVRYYTHMRGYYAPRVPQSYRFDALPGVGGLSNWGKPLD